MTSGNAPTPTNTDENVKYNTNKDLLKHPDVQEYLHPEPKNVLDLLSPLKLKLYKENLAQNNGKFVNNQMVKLDNQTYKLSLSKREQRALEPSVYAESYRINGSWKKTYVWLRLFRQMSLLDALTQCHFSSKRKAKEVGEMFERAREDAVKLGLKPEELVVEQIWVGKDGGDRKRLNCQGRGRSGIITSHFVHVKAILKPRSVLDSRKEAAKVKKDKKLWFPLSNRKIKEDLVQTANYKW